jgi:hypothetical protein
MKKLLTIIVLSLTMTDVMSLASENVPSWVDFADPFELEFPDKYNSRENPYVIDSPEKLAYLALRVNEKNEHYQKACYKLTENIDLSLYLWVPVSVFKGYFDGNKKTVSHLTIDGNKIPANGRTGVFGLFGILENAAIVDLTLTEVDIKGEIIHRPEYMKMNYTGALAGIITSEKETPTTVTGCHVASGKIRGGVACSAYTGGIVGGLFFYWKIEDCSNNSAVTGGMGENLDSCTGGIAGIASGFGKISSCTNNGAITGGQAMGVTYHFNSEVIMHGSTTGGIAGFSDASKIAVNTSRYPRIKEEQIVEHCKNTGDIAGAVVASEYNGKKSVYITGGIIGKAYADQGNTLVVKNLQNAGTVTNAKEAGDAPLNTHIDELIALQKIYSDGEIRVVKSD